MTPHIRPATPADAPAIAQLLRLQMEEHSLPFHAERISAALAAVFATPSLGSFLLVEGEGTLIGVAYIAFLHSMEHAATIPLLEELYVLERYRGRGLGSALLNEVLKRFSQRTGLPMELEIDSTHRQVEGLYRRHGFTLRTRTRWIYEPAIGGTVAV
jgi:GNAT superfamily N-acetyltransferase